MNSGRVRRTLGAVRLPGITRITTMAHLVDKIHLPDKQKLDRVESVIVLGLIGSGLAACVLGAVVYDFGRMFSVW
jgi:hypothetical protein